MCNFTSDISTTLLTVLALQG